MDSPRRLHTYYRTKRPRERIVTMLSEHGDLSIHTILRRYNQTWKHGLTMKQLAGILSSDGRFEQTGSEKIHGITGSQYRSTIWGSVPVVET